MTDHNRFHSSPDQFTVQRADFLHWPPLLVEEEPVDSCNQLINQHHNSVKEQACLWYVQDESILLLSLVLEYDLYLQVQTLLSRLLAEEFYFVNTIL